MAIGTKLRAMRKGMGFTQQKLADDVGVSRIYIQALESGRRSPSMKLIHRLAETLQASISDFIDDYASRAPRMQLEHLLSSGEVDIWFRKHRLTPEEARRVERVVEAVLCEWDEDDEENRPKHEE